MTTIEKTRVNITPLGDRILVRPVEEEWTTSSGLVLPDTAKERPQEGDVLAVGSGRVTDEGRRLPLDVATGDRVLFARYAGTEVKIEGVEYLILRESDILAKKLS